jgi:hypothetical protein
MTLRLQVWQPRCIRRHVPVDSLLAAHIGGHRWKASNRVRYHHLYRVFFRSMRRQCSIVMSHTDTAWTGCTFIYR